MIKTKWLINLDEDITATAIDNAKAHLGSCPDILTNIKAAPLKQDLRIFINKMASTNADIKIDLSAFMSAKRYLSAKRYVSAKRDC